MFCPACGVRNEPGLLQCFICKKSLPSLDYEAAPARTRPQTVRTVAAQSDVYGSVGDRMLALLFDRVLLGTLLVIPFTLLAERWPQIENRLPSLTGSVVGSAIGLTLITFLYHFVLEAAMGTTLGKAIFGLKVLNESDRNRVAASAIRNALRLVDAIAFYALGFLVAVFSPRKQRLGDHIAGTVVIERSLPWGLRATFLGVWLLLIAGTIWFSRTLCPDCVPAFDIRPRW